MAIDPGDFGRPHEHEWRLHDSQPCETGTFDTHTCYLDGCQSIRKSWPEMDEFFQSIAFPGAKLAYFEAKISYHWWNLHQVAADLDQLAQLKIAAREGVKIYPVDLGPRLN